MSGLHEQAEQRSCECSACMSPTGRFVAFVRWRAAPATCSTVGARAMGATERRAEGPFVLEHLDRLDGQGTSARPLLI